jgi:hypothetical protein
MIQKSNRELTLEMILSLKEYVYYRIPNKKNAEKYADTIDFIYSLLHNCASFEEQIEKIDWLYSMHGYINSGTKYEKEYFIKALDHCWDIVQSVNRRFGEKRKDTFLH